MSETPQPPQPNQPPPSPQWYPQPPIVIKQETSPGTKIAVWIIALILGAPILVALICCAGVMVTSAGNR